MFRLLPFTIFFALSSITSADVSVYTTAEVSCGDFKYELLSDHSVKLINLEDIVIFSGAVYQDWNEFKTDDKSRSLLVIDGSTITDFVIPYGQDQFDLSFGIKLVFELVGEKVVSAKSLETVYYPSSGVFKNNEYNVNCRLNRL